MSQSGQLARDTRGRLRRAEWEVRDVSHSIAEAFVEAHHYAGACSPVSTFTHGLFVREDRRLWGVALWVPPVCGAGRPRIRGAGRAGGLPRGEGRDGGAVSLSVTDDDRAGLVARLESALRLESFFRRSVAAALSAVADALLVDDRTTEDHWTRQAERSRERLIEARARADALKAQLGRSARGEREPASGPGVGA